MGTPLADLDELVLRCRDESARALISEAVNSYKAGAFRSSIVATWVAVCFDIVEKFQELALAGDANAQRKVEEHEKIRAQNDVVAALRFEKQLLAMARDEFEFLSPLQFIDLERLYQDRNRCAHPSLVAEEEHYKPSAELSRLHILSAVDHLLRHPPVQGKFALERVLGAIDSEYFPSNVDEAVRVLEVGALRRPKDSLVRGVITVTLKQLLDGPGAKRRRIIAALAAVSRLHGAAYEATLAAKASPLLRAIRDEDMLRCVTFVRDVPSAWEALDVDVQTRIKGYVANVPSDLLEFAGDLESFPPLAADARKRIRRATRAEIVDSVVFGLSPALADRVVELYLGSLNWDAANTMAGVILGYKSDFSTAQIQRIIEGAAGNVEVRDSFRLGDVVRAFRNSGKIEAAHFERLLVRNNLEGFVVDDFEEPAD